eukprot:10883705-Lingulodinium_polyedra.AAC.1
MATQAIEAGDSGPQHLRAEMPLRRQNAFLGRWLSMGGARSRSTLNSSSTGHRTPVCPGQRRQNAK